MQRELERFFSARFPDLDDDWTIEIRAFPARGGGKGYREFLSTPEEAAAYVRTLPKDIEIYYGINPRLGRDGTKAGVAGACCLQADADDKHFGGDPKLSEEACFALDYPPSFIVRSGNGWHAYWQLDETLGPDQIARVEAANKRIAHALGGLDAVQDASRILRVPGTFNNKDPENPKPVTLDHETGRTYSLEQIESCLPALPPEQEANHREVAHLLGPDDRPSPEYMREMLGWCDPCLPEAEYRSVWMAVARYFPGQDGWDMVDEWSSDAREKNGQTSSPRTDPGRHFRFRRAAGNVTTMGTIVHYAKLGGWTPPERILVLPTTGKGRRRQSEATLQEKRDAIPNPTYHDLPHYLRRVYDLLGPLTEALDRDYTTQMALVGWSQFFPGWRIENLPLNLWGLGVAGSGAGKNLISDAIVDLYGLVPGHGDLYTSGSPEGLLRSLDGDGKVVHCYYDEMADTLKTLEKDYMTGMGGQLCSLHDGRDIAHRLSKQSLIITNPYAVVTATTTPNKLVASLREEDLDGGLASRFWITLPNTRATGVRHTLDPRAMKALAEEIGQHLQDLHAGPGRRAVFYQDVPDELLTLERELGIGADEWRTFEDELADPRVARGRHVSRWKVKSVLLESMKARPAMDRGHLLVTRESCQLGLALTRRGVVDQDRLVLRLTGSEDARSLEQVRRAIERSPKGITKSDLLRRTRVKAQELGRLLQVLEDSRDVEIGEDASGRTIWRPLGGRPMASLERARA